MSPAVSKTDRTPPDPDRALMRRSTLLPREWLRGVAGASAASSLLLIAAITVVVAIRAWPAIQHYGLSFVWGSQWNPITDEYGALPLIFGTLVSSVLALLIAAPLGVSVAIVLTEKVLPAGLRHFLGSLVELLAAIPSVIYGLWGIAVVIPLTTDFGRWLFKHFHAFPLFSTAPVGPGMLPAALVLAVMILPTIAALARNSLRNVPPQFIEGAYALGATRWEVLLQIALPSAKTGILGAIILAMGRAMGETMALAMLVGNSNRISPSLLAPANTISSLLANSFGEASGLQLSALMYLSLILMVMTLLMNFAAQSLLGRAPRLRAGS